MTLAPEPTLEMADRLRPAIARLARLLRQQSDDELGATSVGALVTIVKRGPVTLSELAASERVSPPTITKVVEKLEGMGLVAREVDESDRRVTRLRTTRAGERYLERTRARRTAWLAARLDELSDDHRDQLMTALDALHALADSPADADDRPK